MFESVLTTNEVPTLYIGLEKLIVLLLSSVIVNYPPVISKSVFFSPIFILSSEFINSTKLTL